MKHEQGFLLCSCSKNTANKRNWGGGGNVKSEITQFNLAEKVGNN